MANTMTRNGRTIRWTMIPAGSLGKLDAWWRDSLAKASRDETFRSYVSDDALAIPEDKAWARSVVLAAVDFPPRRLPFAFEGEHRSIIQPPSYYRNAIARPDIKELLASALSASGAAVRLEDADGLPLKLLCASSGLGAYGRNCIFYADGLGTAASLLGLWCDAEASIPPEDAGAPIHASAFAGPSRLQQCAACKACVTRCPNGAIPEDFGVLDAGRCIPLWNETGRELPEFMPKSAPNALVGCALCQKDCPANKGRWDDLQSLPELSESDTRHLLKCEWDDRLRTLLGAITGLENDDWLKEWAPMIKRNLGDFIASGRAS